MKNKSIIQYGPIVCAVGNSYQIRIPVRKKALMSVVVGDKEYFNHSNGIRRSDCIIQQFEIPAKELDEAKEYTVKYEEVILRLPYSCKKKPMQSETFSFRPIQKSKGINIYHIADTHGKEKAAVDAGSYFGDNLDLLILNGDISSSCDTVDEIMLSYKIAYGITKGRIPCIITRGNHDLRGKLSEKLEEMLPSKQGKSYYTVKLGCMWFIVLDCGEDKEDSHSEYSGTAAFHQMRLDETDFIQNIIENAENEYADSNVKYRFAVCHIPFTYKNTEEKRGERPFNIENEIYDKWTALLSESIRPQLIICGHLHEAEIFRKGGKNDHRNSPCDVLIGSKTRKDNMNDFIGAAIKINPDGCEVIFTDNNQAETGKESVEFGKQ